MRYVDIVVVGGGPAGAATACGLAAIGREVLLIERSLGSHHKVCGEFISPETAAHLVQLGVDPSALGAVSIDRVCLAGRNRSVSTDLPSTGLSLSRFRLDEAIRRRAECLGAEVWRGVRVQSITRRDKNWVLYSNGNGPIHCRNLVYATGKSGLRGLPDLRGRSMVGLKIHLYPSRSAAIALAGQTALFLLDKGYAGLQMVEDGLANLCLILPASKVAGIGRGWRPLRDFLMQNNPHLGKRLETLSALSDTPLAVVCPKGGYIYRSPGFEGESSLYPVGDRLGHIPPFTGDGLAIALGSAALVVESLRRGVSAAQYLLTARRGIERAVRVARGVSWLATDGIGQSILTGASSCSPELVRWIFRATRVPNTRFKPYPVIRGQFQFPASGKFLPLAGDGPQHSASAPGITPNNYSL